MDRNLKLPPNTPLERGPLSAKRVPVSSATATVLSLRSVFDPRCEMCSPMWFDHHGSARTNLIATVPAHRCDKLSHDAATEAGVSNRGHKPSCA